MIRYALACDEGHAFESWFRSADSYDEQAASGFVSCPICGSAHIAKQLMAPSLARGDRGAEPETAPMPVAAAPDPRLRAMVRAMREELAARSEHVGERFPEEARKIHYGETDARAIHGEASAAEVRALIDEGVEILPLPVLPEERN